MLDKDFVELAAVKAFKKTDFELEEAIQFAGVIEVAAKRELYDGFIKMLSDIDREVKNETANHILRIIIQGLIVGRQ